ncbi:MAG: RDD family protein [Vibrio sp.]
MEKFELSDSPMEYEYVGFWSRVGASIVDNILYSIVMFLVALPSIERVSHSYSTQTADSTFSSFSTTWTNNISSGSWWEYLPPLIITVLFWKFRGATPGKMLVKAQVVDAKTGNRLSTVQSVLRFVGYFISMLFFMLGFIWVAFDKKKQGFHDKIAGTVVIRPKHDITFKPKAFDEK